VVPPFYQETVSFCFTFLRKGMSRHFYDLWDSPLKLAVTDRAEKRITVEHYATGKR
jgi:hypothetical protein